MSFIYTPLETYRDQGCSNFLKIVRAQNLRLQEGKMKQFSCFGKGKIQPRTGHESPEGE
jgi:hypothetical protein